MKSQSLENSVTIILTTMVQNRDLQDIESTFFFLINKKFESI